MGSRTQSVWHGAGFGVLNHQIGTPPWKKERLGSHTRHLGPTISNRKFYFQGFVPAFPGPEVA